MKNKPTKVRPPRIYRTKTGRPYIKHKGKRIYLNFGKKTNDMSNLSILKLFLKYLGTKKRDIKNKTSKAQVIYPDTDRIELENRQRVDSQVRNYLRDKYEKINEMDKAEEKKRKEAKERAEEKKKEDEAKARQELKDAAERKRDIDRAIDRERKLQAELKADRAVSRTLLKQLTASNDRIERLIEEGKNIARSLEEVDIDESIQIEETPRKLIEDRDGGDIVGEVEDKGEEKKRPQPPPGKPPPKKEKKSSKDVLKEMGKVHAEVVSERKSLQKDLAEQKRDAIIDKMFEKPIAHNESGRVQPKHLIQTLRKLEYDVKNVYNKKNRLNEKETVKRFLRNHPEDFGLGTSDKQGWSNLLLILGSKMNALNKAKEAEKKKSKEGKDHSSVSSAGAEAVEAVDDNDLVDDSAEEDPDQVGIGALDIRDECIKIIGKLKVGDIKKFLKKTHTDAYRKKYRHKGKLLKFNYIEALILAMADDGIRVAVCSKLNGQVGGGADPQKGLTTTQIDGLMEDEKRYLGTVASDEIKTLKPKGTKYAFIMNTDKASKPGQHWIAVYISGKDDKTVEVYDPLGTYEPTKEFLEQIKTLVDKMKLDHYLLLKVNKIKNQSDTSDTCGWFAVKFLKERFLGNRFKFSTGFTQLKEDEIQKYKKQNGDI